MGSVTLGVNHEIVLNLRDQLGIDTFIETGTWRGGTTEWAAQHFKHVITMEGMPGRFNKTYQNLHPRYPNIMFLLGDSKHLMSCVMEFLQVPAIFWLDAHYCTSNDEERAHGIVKCPVMFELLAINQHKQAHLHALMVDDARLFGVESEWPRMEVLTSELAQHGRRVVTYEDVVYGVPAGFTGKLPSEA